MNKLSLEAQAEVREKYASGNYTIRTLALEYGVSHTTIGRIIKPENYKKEKEKNRIRMKNADYSTSTKSISFKFNTETDAPVIEKLESVPNRHDYLRQLILSDIQQEKEE